MGAWSPFCPGMHRSREQNEPSGWHSEINETTKESGQAGTALLAHSTSNKPHKT